VIIRLDNISGHTLKLIKRWWDGEKVAGESGATVDNSLKAILKHAKNLFDEAGWKAFWIFLCRAYWRRVRTLQDVHNNPRTYLPA
jgi:hypothetical protein